MCPRTSEGLSECVRAVPCQSEADFVKISLFTINGDKEKEIVAVVLLFELLQRKLKKINFA